MDITEDMIERFIIGDCSAAEKKNVLEYFRRHPDLLQSLLSEKSWRVFETPLGLPTDTSVRMLNNIRAVTRPGKTAIIVRYPWLSAAAMVIVVLCVYLFTNDFKEQQFVDLSDKHPIEKKTYQQNINLTNSPVSLALSDGTIIELSPGSELAYDSLFAGNRRDVFLKGQALFHVAKDPARPFTVYAGRLATTALGTIFKITAFSGETKTTSILLLEGKIVVNPDSILKTRGIQQAILQPGQELRFDPIKQLAFVRIKEIMHANAAHRKTLHKRDTSPNDILRFHDEPLASVFDALAQKYQQRISYSRIQLSGMSFTGEFNNKESIFEFIQTACQLNGLTVHRSDKMIIVSSP
ncbi:FecR family protein [Flavitalea sp.]|nr:FecR domain-containing protein [Flavitalea sp.]